MLYKKNIYQCIDKIMEKIKKEKGKRKKKKDIITDMK